MAEGTARKLLIRTLLLSGVLSSVTYVASDVVGALSYPGYDYAAQAISEMSAIGAPTPPLLGPLYRLFSILFVAFAVGVWLTGRSRPPLRWAAGFLLGVTVVGTGFGLFPMNMRGVARTFSDTMHLVTATAIIVLLSSAILTGSSALSAPFRRYSSATVAVMVVFFGLTLLDAPNVAANLPTPFMGLKERICIASWLLWIAAFAIQLLRLKHERVASHSS